MNESGTSSKKLGDLLKNLRTANGSLYYELASASGLNPRTIMRWEAGLHSPRVPELDLLLSTLNATPEQKLHTFAIFETPRTVRKIRELASLSPPFPGDILRVLRVRKGLTQSEVAIKTSIRQATLAKWEASEDWPDPNRISSLCHCLGASSEEMEALMKFRFSPGAQSLEEVIENLDRTTGSLMRNPLPTDLEFMALESRFWRATLMDTKYQPFLNHIYGRHARKLSYAGKFNSARPYIIEAIRSTHFNKTHDLFFRDALIARVLLPEKVSKSRQLQIQRERAMEGLELIDRIADKAWMMDQVAECTAEQGDFETAIKYCEEAFAITTTLPENSDLIWARNMSRASIESKRGKHLLAIDKISELSTTIPEDRDYKINLGLCAARVFKNANYTDQTKEWVEYSRTLIVQNDQPQFLDELHSISS